MIQSNGCSTLAPRSSAARQWFEELAQKKKILNADSDKTLNPKTSYLNGPKAT